MVIKKLTKKKLDKKKLEVFKNLLLKMKENIIHDIKNMSSVDSGAKDASVDASGHALHMADVATDMYDREFNLGLASKDRELLHKIDAALQRIEEGTYGICMGTGKAITQARLKAIPYAEYCLSHQEELENSGEIR